MRIHPEPSERPGHQKADDYQDRNGGISGDVDDRGAHLVVAMIGGRRRLVGVFCEAHVELVEPIASLYGATVINIAIDGKLAGLFAIADPIKPSTPDALRALAADGIKVIMLTEDNKTTANAVAKRLGISGVEAEVLPDQKSAVVSKLQKAGRIVAMARDGVNDAPALAAAEVGIAMGTDVAKESAGGNPVEGRSRGHRRARLLSEATMANIRAKLGKSDGRVRSEPTWQPGNCGDVSLRTR